MGRQAELDDMINDSRNEVLDFGGQIYLVDGTITVGTTGNIPKVIRNLVIYYDSDTDQPVLDFSYTSGEITLENIQVIKKNTTRAGTGIRLARYGTVWKNLYIDGFDEGLIIYGASLNRFYGGHITDCNTNLYFGARADTPSQDNQFFGMRFTEAQSYGLDSADAGGNVVGRRIATNTQFFGCQFEQSNLSAYGARLNNMFYTTFFGGRFETAATHTNPIVKLTTTDGSGTYTTGSTTNTKFIGTVITGSGAGGTVTIDSPVNYTFFESCVIEPAATITNNGTNTKYLFTEDYGIIPIDYGSQYVSSASSTSCVDSGYTVMNGTYTAGELFNFSHTTPTLTYNGAQGTFLIAAHISCSTTGAPKTFTWGVSINSATPGANALNDIYMASNSANYPSFVTFLVDLVEGDTVEVVGRSSSGTISFTLQRCSLTVTQVR